MSLFGYCLREARKSIGRNPFLSIATVFTAAIALLVLATFLLGAANLQNLAEFVERQVNVAIFLRDGVAPADRDSLKANVAGIAGVEEITFVSRETALQRLRDKFGENAALLDGIDEFNPLRDSLEVRVGSAAAVDLVAEAVKASPLVDEISYGKELVARLVSVTRALRLGILGLAGLLGLATLFLIQNSIRLSVFARREEISIMRLVGATDSVIRWPLVFEGIVLAAGGALVATLAVGVVYQWLWQAMGRNLAFLPVLPLAAVLGRVGGVVVLTGVVIGAAGALLAMRRWLRV
ncbi:MAG: permease-like cell division protein FtsX [Bacillota bacterium]|nr:permease-like cell division protein FtsX [Bacillota bacterium]